MKKRDAAPLPPLEPQEQYEPQKPRPQKKRHMRFKTKITLFLLLILFLFGIFVAGVVYGGKEKPQAVTSDLISERLQAVQELVSIEYHYTNMGKFENQKDFYGWKVPFTTKSFIVSYDGVIKAGVDLDSASVEVEGSTVIVSMPVSRILSHEIDEDSIEVFDESHNIFNPIKIEDYTGFTAREKAEIERKAIEKGLLAEADKKAQEAITALLSAMPGMEDYELGVFTVGEHLVPVPTP